VRKRKVKQSWSNLKTIWSDCKKCKLCKHRKKVVLGKGPRDAEIFLIGQAPGKTEDALGKPFVGIIGQLLRKLMKIVKMEPDVMYITNSVCCFPKADRMPTVHEVKTCWPRLKMEIELVKPRFIIFCGGRAASIPGLKEEYNDFFLQYTCFSMFHPGSIRRDGWRREAILNQLKHIKHEIKRRKGKVA